MIVDLGGVADFCWLRVQPDRETRENPVGSGNIRKHDVGLGKDSRNAAFGVAERHTRFRRRSLLVA
jgi:hypothetical protein